MITHTADEVEEMVVLVDDAGDPLGTAPKAEVHTQDTPLHLAFSCYLFDPEGRLLVTRRSLDKIAWPGVWTNSFCGHPLPGEPLTEAVQRRGAQELGVEVHSVNVVLPDFRYRAVDPSGIVEHEICPVHLAQTAETVDPDPAEVGQWQWIRPETLADAVHAAPFAFSPWMTLQLPAILDSLGVRRS